MAVYSPGGEAHINSFSDELRRLRRAAGLSQATLAERAGLSTEAISLLERGRRTPRPTTMRLLADALELAEAERAALFLALPGRLPPQHELPRYGDVLIARAAEIDQVVDLLTSGPVRLVTLTGPGGVGKSRVAVAAASAAAAQFTAGVRWVHAMSCDGEEQLVAAVATALGLESSGSSVAAIAHALPDDDRLLVIDGAEPFLETVAAVCDTLTRRRTGLRLVVTSRERLHIAGERPVIIAPLPYAEPGDEEIPASRTVSPASRLFLARAPFSRQPRAEADEPGGLSAADAAAVARICRRVDGIPLAIELAAARTTLLTVGELATALDKSLRYLYSPHADDEVALRDVMVADSFPRLSAREQELLARLSVFSTGFTADAVAAVCTDVAEPAAVDVLSLLVSKSLVLRGADAAGSATFRLLRVVREYAEDQLDAHPGALDVRRRHAHYFRDLAVQAAEHLVGSDKRGWSLVLDGESDNLRQALDWCLRHDNDSALVMVGALWRWWHLRGHYREGRSAATAALRSGGRAAEQLRAPASTAAGMLALLECDYEAAQTHIQQGLDLYSVGQDQAGVRWSLALLGSVALQRGEYTVAGQLHEQALVLARRAQDAHSVAVQHNALAQVSWLRGNIAQAEDHAHRGLEIMSRLGDQQGIGWALLNLGATARYGADLAAAQVFLTHSLERSSRIDYREGEAWALNQLGVVSRLQGDHASALSQQRSSLEQHRRLGNRWRMASVLDELAAVALATDDPERATAQLGAAEQIRREIGAVVPAAEKAARDDTLAGARSRLGSTFPALTLAGLAQHRP